MKRIDQDPFSNGTEHMMFEEVCCNHCVKASKIKKDGTYTNCDKDNIPNRCGIERDIVLRMFCDHPITQLTLTVCTNFVLKGIKCPYMATHWPKRKKRVCKEQLSFDFKD